MKSSSAKNIHEYLSELPVDQRKALQKLRKQILSAVPKAEEVISYHIPTFKYGGYGLVGMGAFKDHCSFFIMSSGLKEIIGIKQTTIHFNPEDGLPEELVNKIVYARMMENESRKQKKGKPISKAR